ncbi:MAG: DUF1080 domain-containing protein [Planctomycetota bacterium]|nr:MAG: DUF1080 domain-containing protein [Planctomycetota bacterium]
MNKLRIIVPIVLLGAAFVLALPAVPADGGQGVIHLFNGKDLTNFYTWLGAPAKGEKPYGKNNDPEKVFTVHDGMVHVSGKVFGGFITEQEYENYHLVVEFKWGEKTWPPREDRARDSGVLVHSHGEDGSAGGHWMPAVEYQMIEGGTGDLILVGAKQDKPSLTAEAEKRGDQYYFKPGAEAITLDSGRFNWYGRDPNWKDWKGFRGNQDVEKPVGEWNTIECICDGDKITNILNGKTVNAGSKCSVTKGKILFQSEGAEVFFRKIDLVLLKK